MIPLFLALVTVGHDPCAAAEPERASAGRASLSAPAGFLENRGQWPDAARFRAQARGSQAWFVDDGWWVVLRGPELGARLRMTFEGARATRPEPEGPLPGKHHFLRGPDPSAFVRGARAYERLRWPGLHGGVDLVARPGEAGGRGALFEYDLELAPGASLERVAVRVAGHAALAIDAEGRLNVETAAGTLVETPPRAWQLTPAGIEPLECRFRLLDGERFGFECPRRDPGLPACIDPALIFSTYLSGDGDQTVEEIAAGPLDDVFVAGNVESNAFPTTAGAFQVQAGVYSDCFVTRFDAQGQLLWSTYLCGTNVDLLGGLAVDASGAATVCGDTNSLDFPTLPGSFDTTPGGFFDAFCARLAPGGDALLFGTFLGGTLNDRAADLALDASGAATVVGSTNGGGFPVTNPVYDSTFNGGQFAGDAFCTRIAPSGKQLVWSTFFGGPLDEGATAVAVESTGEVTVGGIGGGSVPVTLGAFQTTYKPPGEAWVLRLNATGTQRVYSTYLGGANLEQITRILVDGTGASVLAGRTEGADFPVTPQALDTVFAGASEGFLLELNAQGSALTWSTFVGGALDDEVAGLAAVPGGGLIAAGTSTSSDLPTTLGSYAPEFHDSLFGLFDDGFVLKLGPQAQAIDYGTYFGTEDGDVIRDVALDSTGATLLCGGTDAADFPTTPGAFQQGFNALALREGFVSRLALLRHPIPYGTGTPPGSGGVAVIDWTGFPDMSGNFRLRINNAAANTKAILFHGFAPQANPFYSGTMLVKPPLYRHKPVTTDSFGFKSTAAKLDPSWIGSTVYFQWWFEDPLLKKSAGLSNALEVVVYP